MKGTAERNKTILAKYRTLRAKKIRQWDALDVIRSEQEKPLEYTTLLHIITEEAQNEREQSRSIQMQR